MFEPVQIEEREIGNSDSIIQEDLTESENNEENAKVIDENLEPVESNNEITFKNKNIFDEEEQKNIFTDDNVINLFDNKEPIKKENNIPLDFELPKLKKK